MGTRPWKRFFQCSHAATAYSTSWSKLHYTSSPRAKSDQNIRVAIPFSSLSSRLINGNLEALPCIILLDTLKYSSSAPQLKELRLFCKKHQIENYSTPRCPSSRRQARTTASPQARLISAPMLSLTAQGTLSTKTSSHAGQSQQRASRAPTLAHHKQN